VWGKNTPDVHRGCFLILPLAAAVAALAHAPGEFFQSGDYNDYRPGDIYETGSQDAKRSEKEDEAEEHHEHGHNLVVRTAASHSSRL